MSDRRGFFKELLREAVDVVQEVSSALQSVGEPEPWRPPPPVPARPSTRLVDDEIEATIVEDLCRLYPDARGIVREVIVQRWERAIPFAAPGRSRVQAALERGVDDVVFFAGDYVGEWTHMEAAVVTAGEAAAAARARVVALPAA